MYQERIWHFFFFFFGEGRIWQFIERIWHINIHPPPPQHTHTPTHIYIYIM